MFLRPRPNGIGFPSDHRSFVFLFVLFARRDDVCQVTVSTGAQELVVESQNPSCDGGPVESQRGSSACLGTPSTQLTIRKQSPDPIGERRAVRISENVDEKALDAVTHDVPEPWSVGRHDGAASGHGLEHDDSKGATQGGTKKDIP